ncbi:MAG: FtsX-like permease family protein [Candidatus Omnitrophica bacterium]|nr:FtsX-like permease family protein [Candidatus Omnitrophota bacterium]
MRYEFWLGLRYLFAKRRERFISIIALLSIGGVALGVAALLVVIAVMSGFDHDIKEKLVGTNAHLIVDTPVGVRDAEPLLRSVSAMDHVVGAAPFISGQAILRLPDQAFGVLVRGIDGQRESRVNRLAEYLVAGRLPATDDEVVIGTELRAQLGASLGDPLLLISPADGSTHRLTLSGFFRSGMYEYDANLIAMTLARAQQFYGLGGIVTGIGVKLDRLEHSPEAKAAIERDLGGAYRVRTWMELNPALFGALRVEKTVMFVILTLIIVVAALNITSMLIMIVMERTKDIGILRALGATRGSIAALFLSQGAVIGVLGIGLGLLGGLALTWNLNRLVTWLEETIGVSLFPPTVYYLDHIPTRIDAADVVTVTAAAFALAVLGGTYAAARAARLSPVDALRYE